MVKDEERTKEVIAEGREDGGVVVNVGKDEDKIKEVIDEG